MHTNIDTSTLTELAERHYPELRRIARRMAGSSGIGDDLVQDAFLAAIRRFERYDPSRSFVAWMSAIIRHRFLRHLYDRKRCEMPFENEALDAFVDSEGTGERHVEAERRHTIRVARDCVNALPSRTRRIFDLYYQEGMNTEEIGKRLRITGCAVRVQLHRGRNHLRGMIGRRLQRDGFRRAA